MNVLAKTIILQHHDIVLKLERMAWQVLELYHDAKEISIIGIEPKGKIVSTLLQDAIKKISNVSVKEGSIIINKENPASGDIQLVDIDSLKDKYVILVDDVLNSGKTLIHATSPILKQDPASLHTVILANRDHASFPIKADIVGVSLATTLQEHITFQLDKNGEMVVYLT